MSALNPMSGSSFCAKPELVHSSKTNSEDDKGFMPCTRKVGSRNVTHTIEATPEIFSVPIVFARIRIEQPAFER